MYMPKRGHCTNFFFPPLIGHQPYIFQKITIVSFFTVIISENILHIHSKTTVIIIKQYDDVCVKYFLKIISIF